MLKGSCLCQQVEYQFDGQIEEVAMCHCNQCKRAQGTPFVTNAPVSAELFAFTKGKELVKEYFSSPNKKRAFCGNCGSPFYSQRTDMPETVRLRLGTVTEGKIPEPQYEIYCESKAKWFTPDSLRPQFLENKP